MKYLNFKNSTLAYSDEGEGPVIVLLHGFLENSKMWHKIVPALLREYRVICIDLLGHGETESIGYVHTMEDMADAVHYILHFLQLKKVVLIARNHGRTCFNEFDCQRR